MKDAAWIDHSSLMWLSRHRIGFLFAAHSMIAKDLVPGSGAKGFAIMRKELASSVIRSESSPSGTLGDLAVAQW